MSLVTLFYGQCGNQIGDVFYSDIFKEISDLKKDSPYYNRSLNQWFQITKSNKWQPRSILIDTEQKTLPSERNSRYQFNNIVLKGYGGSANNWAFGYTERSKLLLGDVEESIRKELENSDEKVSFLNIFSSSGGTGAGVGTAVIEFLKNEFPNRLLLNGIVLPYMKGEVVIQSYNTLLSLSKIYPISDAIMFFENDRLHYNCENSLNIKNVSFDHINSLISRQLLGVLQPIKDTYVPDMLASLCTPDLKFLQIKSAPLSSLEKDTIWKGLLQSISRQSRFDLSKKTNLKHESYSTALICRGVYKPNETDLKPFRDKNACKILQYYYQRQRIFHLDNSLTLLTNGNNVFVPLKSIYQDAKNLFKYEAYVHHYKKFNVDETDFNSSFKITESILNHYVNNLK